MASLDSYWTREQERRLFLDYGKLTPKQLAKKLHKTPQAIKDKALRMGLTKRQHRWTLKEERRLLELLKVHTQRQAASMMGVTADSVNWRVRQARRRFGCA